MDMDMDMEMTIFLFRFEPKQIKIPSVLVFFAKLKKTFLVCFSVFWNRFETNQNKISGFETNRKWRLIHFYVMDMDMYMAIVLLFQFVFKDPWGVLITSKHWNKLLLYLSITTETNVLFRIVSKLVSVPVKVISKRN